MVTTAEPGAARPHVFGVKWSGTASSAAGPTDAELATATNWTKVATDNKEIGRKARDAVKQLGAETAVKLAAVRSCHGGFSPAAYLRAVSAAEI